MIFLFHFLSRVGWFVFDLTFWLEPKLLRLPVGHVVVAEILTKKYTQFDEHYKKNKTEVLGDILGVLFMISILPNQPFFPNIFGVVIGKLVFLEVGVEKLALLGMKVGKLALLGKVRWSEKLPN